MNKIYILLFLVVYPALLFPQIPGKRETRYGFEINVKPPIYYTPFVTFQDSSWQPYLHFNLKIQNDLLQFIKEEEKYVARYEVLLTVMNQQTDSVFHSEIWRDEVIVNDFAETNAKWIYHNSGTMFSLTNIANDLLLDVEVTDLSNFQRYRNRRTLDIKQLKKNYLRVGPITFFDPDSVLPAEIILPAGDPIIDFNEDQVVRFTASSALTDTLEIITHLMTTSHKQETEVFKKRDKFLFSHGFLAVADTISKSFLDEGTYALVFDFIIGKKTDRVEKKFEVVWYDKPIYMYKFDLALRPMRYILSKEQWEDVDELSYASQEKWFNEYWEERDPSPQTPFNELAYEFFSRVDEANREYSSRFTEGWETDRGKAFILYGKPDRKEEKTYLTNSKPYEIWFYDSMKQKLTFVDIDNDANYKLVTVEDLTETDNE